MGQSLYTFHFLDTVSSQLKAHLDLLPVSPLTNRALEALAQLQRDENASQGVYVLHYRSEPAYLGKANDVLERLQQHYEKLRGRRGIDLSQAGYKALLLDASMSTAANEDVLIALYRKSHSGLWNGRGFGPKDPGRERDTTKPSWFDRTYPIVDDYMVMPLPDTIRLGDLLGAMKSRLPYVFRYEVPASEQDRIISIAGVGREANALLQHIVDFLGDGWRGVIISYGMILYRNEKQYPHGTVLVPRSALESS